MQFNLVNDQEQVAQFVWRGVAQHGVAQHCGAWCQHQGLLRRMPEAFVAQVFYWSVGCLPRAFLGSSSGQRLLGILGVRLRMASWLWLGSAFGVVVFVCFLVFFPLLPLPIQGSRGLSSIVFSIELTVQCDGCLIQGLGWWAGLVAELQVGQAYGVFHRPGFGLLVSVPRSLGTQPPFVTQALIDHFRILTAGLDLA